MNKDSVALGRIALLSLLLLLGLGVRLVALSQVHESVYDTYLLPDERIYHDWAISIADGSFESKQPYQFSPLPAYVMSAGYSLLGDNVYRIRVLNLLFNLGTCFLIYLLARSVFEYRIAVLALAIACFYKPFILYSVVPLKTAIAVFFLALAVLLLLHALRVGKCVWYGVAGVALGLAVLAREHALILLPAAVSLTVVGVGRLFGGAQALWRRLLLLILGVALAVAPCLVRNYRASGQVVITSSLAGLSFYIANNPENETPYYQPAPFAKADPAVQSLGFQVEALRRTGRELSPAESSRYWFRQGLAFFVRQPVAAARRVGTRILSTLSHWESGDHYNLRFMQQVLPVLAWPLIGIGLILPLAICGLLNAWPNRYARYLSLLILVYGCSLVIFFNAMRFRVYALVMLIPLAASGAASLVDRARHRRLRSLLTSVVAMVITLVTGLLPFTGRNDMTTANNIHAGALYTSGQYEEALRYWERGAAEKGIFSPYSHLALALMAMARGDQPVCESELLQIPDDTFAAAEKYSILGRLKRKQGNMPEAIAAYEKSLAINSSQLDVLQILAALHRKTDPGRAARHREMLFRIMQLNP